MDTGASDEALVWCASAEDTSADDVLVAAGIDVLDDGGKIKTEFQLLPIGTFTLRDGRGPFTIRDQAHAEQVVQASRQFAGAQDMFIDYDHQLIFAAVPGVGGNAPAAGWVKDVFANDKGVACRVDWTKPATEKLNNREYRYISPLFRADKNGNVTRIINAGLVNQPAIDGLGAIAASQTPKEPEMKLTAIAAALGMAAPDSVTEDQVIAAAQALTGHRAALRKAIGAKDDDGDDAVVAAATTLKSAKVAGADDVIVPASVWTDTQSRLAKLEEKDIAAAVDQGVTDGKIVPATKDSMLAWAKKDFPSFEAYLKTAPVIVAAGQTVADRHPGPGVTSLNQDQLVAAAALNISPADYLKTLQGNAQ